MKYLTTFACVSGATAAAVREVHGRRGGRQEEKTKRIREILYESLLTNIDRVAYFRSIMDGWNATHREVARWVARRRPAAAGRWHGFELTNRIVRAPGSHELRALLPFPDPRGVEVFFKRNLGSYAINAFFAALNDALRFHACTRTTLVVVTEVIGPVRGDPEYSDSD